MKSMKKSGKAITYVLVTKSKREFEKLSNTLKKPKNKKPAQVWKNIVKMAAMVEDLRVYPEETAFTTIFDELQVIIPNCIILEAVCFNIPYPPYRGCVLIARDGYCS